MLPFGFVIAYAIYFLSPVSGRGISIGACLIWGLVIAFFSGVYVTLLRSWQELAIRPSTDKWTCTVAEDYWSFRDQDGILVQIPWSTMMLQAEVRDGWAIIYGGKLVTVFRKPLREAGLEEAFRTRIGKGATESEVY